MLKLNLCAVTVFQRTLLPLASTLTETWNN